MDQLYGRQVLKPNTRQSNAGHQAVHGRGRDKVETQERRHGPCSLEMAATYQRTMENLRGQPQRRDQALGQNMEEETPTWSSIVKPILPKVIQIRLNKVFVCACQSKVVKLY